MFIHGIQVMGFRDLASFHVEGLGRVVQLMGESPARVALGDAVELAFAGLSHEGMRQWAVGLGLNSAMKVPAKVDEGFPEQLEVEVGGVAEALLLDGRRDLQVSVEVTLDPPLFGRLRELGGRDPRIAVALAGRPSLRWTVGVLFSATYDMMAIYLNKFQVGEEELALHSGEKVPWAPRFLASLAPRFLRFREGESQLGLIRKALLSRKEHGAYERWRKSLGSPELRLVEEPDGLASLLADELPLRRFGSETRWRAHLAAEIYLGGRDILFSERCDGLLTGAVEGGGCPLEQVWLPGEDAGAVRVIPEEPVEKPLRPAIGIGRPVGLP